MWVLTASLMGDSVSDVSWWVAYQLGNFNKWLVCFFILEAGIINVLQNVDGEVELTYLKNSIYYNIVVLMIYTQRSAVSPFSLMFPVSLCPHTSTVCSWNTNQEVGLLKPESHLVPFHTESSRAFLRHQSESQGNHPPHSEFLACCFPFSTPATLASSCNPRMHLRAFVSVVARSVHLYCPQYSLPPLPKVFIGMSTTSQHRLF